MKIYELNAKGQDVVYEGKDAKCIEVYAFASDETGKKVTIACELMGAEQHVFVYDGEINTSDPGEGPMEEYENREEALASEYAPLFGTIFGLADSMK